jgi:hypothetical protein
MKPTVRELFETGKYKFMMSGVELPSESVERLLTTTVTSLVLTDTVILSVSTMAGSPLSFDIPYELMLGGTVFCRSAIPGEWEFRWRKSFGVLGEWSSLTNEWNVVDVMQLPLGARCTWDVERIPLVGK